MFTINKDALVQANVRIRTVKCFDVEENVADVDDDDDDDDDVDDDDGDLTWRRPPLERIAVYITLFQSSPVSTCDNQPFTKAKFSHYHKVLSFLTCDLKDSEQRVDDGVEV